MYWTLELASKLEDAPWPATRDELLDWALRTGAPQEVIENLQEIEDEGDVYERIEDLWPDYPSKEDFFQTFAKMLENISVNSEGYPFVLPVVGSGLSNTELSEQDLLDFLMKSLKLYRNSFNTDVHVVVYHKKKKLISITSA